MKNSSKSNTLNQFYKCTCMTFLCWWQITYFTTNCSYKFEFPFICMIFYVKCHCLPHWRPYFYYPRYTTKKLTTKIVAGGIIVLWNVYTWIITPTHSHWCSLNNNHFPHNAHFHVFISIFLITNNSNIFTPIIKILTFLRWDNKPNTGSQRKLKVKQKWRQEHKQRASFITNTKLTFR